MGRDPNLRHQSRIVGAVKVEKNGVRITKYEH